jgi:hypothetical protein
MKRGGRIARWVVALFAGNGSDRRHQQPWRRARVRGAMATTAIILLWHSCPGGRRTLVMAAGAIAVVLIVRRAGRAARICDRAAQS